MDEEESTERQMQIAMLCQRLAKMKQLFNDGNNSDLGIAFAKSYFQGTHTLNLALSGNIKFVTSLGMLQKLIKVSTFL